MNCNTKTFAFVLGRERDLCLAELKSVLARFCASHERSRFGFCLNPEQSRMGFTVTSVIENVAFINISDPEQSRTGDEKDDCDVASLMDVLGGTVKIFKIIQNSEVKSQNDKSKLKDLFIDYIKNSERSEKKFNYTISSYSRMFSQRSVFDLGLSIKKELKREMSLRFVEIRDGKEASSILSLKNHFADQGFEFGLFEDNSIGVLIALSNAEEWSERDYDKPAGDKRSGMLPPKLARTMINIALGQAGRLSDVSCQTLEDSTNDKRQTTNCLVIDPFCGSGNILLEGLMLGCDVFGSDVSEKAVRDSEANANWLIQNSKLKIQKPVLSLSKDDKSIVRIVQADATSADFVDLLNTYDLRLTAYDNVAIVAEPYLGEPKKFIPSMNAVRGEYAKVKELYLEFLRNMVQLSNCSIADKNNRAIDSASPAGRQSSNIVLCLVFPLVETLEKKRFSLYSDCVDEIKKIGYTVDQSPLIYGRDYQVVKREIALLTITKG